MKQRNWTEAELNQVRELARVKTPAQIAALLERSVDSVKHKMWAYKIKGYRAWLAEEDEVLLSAPEGTRVADLAAQLGRSWTSVWQRGGKLGAKLHARKRWTEEELQQVRAAAHGKTSVELAGEFGRTARAIEHKLFGCGIRVAGLRARATAPRARQLVKKRVRPVMTVVSRIAYCEVCHAPVVNTFNGWAGHNARMGCNHKATAARVA